MDGSWIYLAWQLLSIPSAWLRSRRFAGLQAGDPAVVLRKALMSPIARADGILWVMQTQAGE